MRLTPHVSRRASADLAAARTPPAVAVRPVVLPRIAAALPAPPPATCNVTCTITPAVPDPIRCEIVNSGPIQLQTPPAGGVGSKA